MELVELEDEIARVVEAERPEVVSRLEALERQRDRLRELLDVLDAQVAETARLLLRIDEVRGAAPQLSLDTVDSTLRGQRVREVAVQILRTRCGVGQSIHYVDWYELVRGAGFTVAGRDPLAAFLTQVSRAPEVESAQPRSGRYRLKAA